MHYASPKEQEQAFYQESPDRRTAVGKTGGTATAPGAYRPGVAGVCLLHRISENGICLYSI